MFRKNEQSEDELMGDLEKDLQEAQENDSEELGKTTSKPQARSSETEDAIDSEDSNYDSHTEELKAEQDDEDSDEDEEEDEEESENDSEEESDEEDSEEESEDEEEDSDEEDDEDEEDSEEDEDTRSKSKQSQPRFISQSRYFHDQRQTKKSFDKITGLLEKLVSTEDKPKTEQQQTQQNKIAEEIAKVAEKANLPPESIQEILGLVQKVIPVEQILERTKVVDQMALEQREQSSFSKEWEDVLPTIQEQFPNATEKQLRQARRLMYDLARTEKYGWTKEHGPLPLDFILFKESREFKTFLHRPKKKTFESGTDVKDDMDLKPKKKDPFDVEYEDMTPDKAKAMEEKLNSMAEDDDVLEIHRGGKVLKVRTTRG